MLCRHPSLTGVCDRSRRCHVVTRLLQVCVTLRATHSAVCVTSAASPRLCNVTAMTTAGTTQTSASVAVRLRHSSTPDQRGRRRMCFVGRDQGGNRGKPGKTGGNRGKPGKTGENRGKPGKTGENRGKPGKTGENRGKPGKTGENQGKPGKTRECKREQDHESYLATYFVVE